MGRGAHSKPGESLPFFMEYIIIWRSSHRDPFVHTDSHDFKESYSSHEQADEAAKKIIEMEGSQSQWYFDYEIYQSSNG